MKKLFGILIAVGVLFSLASCTQMNYGPHTSGETAPMEWENNEWGIVLSAEDVTPTGMTLVCTQSGGNPTGELQTGSPFVIEQLMDGEWLPVPTIHGILDWAWTMEAWIILPENTTKWDVNWDFLYGELAPGTYRIQKKIMDFRAPGDFTEKNYYAEFGIVD